MPHRFKIVAAKDGQFCTQFVYNGEVMFWTENYAGKASAKNAVESMKKNCPGAKVADIDKGETARGYRFELAKSKDGGFFVRFVAANGEPIARTETYKSRTSAKNAIASLQKNGPAAETVDETVKDTAKATARATAKA